MRGGAGNIFYPIWHLEVESLLVLKNNKGTEDNRIRGLDYTVQLSGLFYKRLVNKGNITLFSPDVANGELFKLFFENEEKFTQLYEKLEADPSIRKKTISAVDLFTAMMTERAQTGRIYIHNVDNTTKQGVFIPEVAPVKQSNLCVAPETQVLTDKGFFPIADLEGQDIKVWNGEQFSKTKVFKTGINRPLIKIVTDSGQELECTPEHHFYTQNTYGTKPTKVAATNLVVGDKLIKFDLPIIEGSEVLAHPYDNGFYSADGCFVKSGAHQRIYLYGEKQALEPYFTANYYQFYDQVWEQNRKFMHTRDLKDKYFVPDATYTIESRLQWLAGYLDGDGCVYRNGTNEAFTASSIDKEFLKEIQLMLMTLGVNSKVTFSKGIEGMRKLPANDGSGELKDFYCQQSYRLLISSIDSQKLLALGMQTHRLTMQVRKPQRAAGRFIKVEAIIDEGRIDDTYCFTEPKRNMGMFNGLLTGQCVEVVLPTAPMGSPDEEIALCTLSAINLGLVETNEQMRKATKVVVRALDNLLDYQDYAHSAALKNKLRRTLGVGVVNYAFALAKRGMRYGDKRALEYTHDIFESLQYHLLLASNELAEERGPCELFGHTKYSQGLLPIDLYNKNVDSIIAPTYKLDWESLRTNIAVYGLRTSTLSAIMPSEGSSLISNATNGIEPPRGTVVTKSSKSGAFKHVLPDITNLMYSYDYLWDMPSNKGYLDTCAIIQKFVDQSISANTNYDPSKFDGNKVPLNLLLKDLIYAYKMGLKTLYYHNTRDGSGEEEQDDGCSSGACKI